MTTRRQIIQGLGVGLTSSLLTRGLSWALLLGLLAPAAAWGQVELIVPNVDTNSVTVYARTANGNTAPLRTLSGAATGLVFPQSVAMDPVADELFVVNIFNSITVYARTASGNAAPLRTLSGPATGLAGAQSVAVDPAADELFVVNFSNSSITVYARTATGNAAPLRTLSGPATGLSFPSTVVVDLTRDELIVVNTGNDSVTAYPRAASGNTAPLRTLAGAATGLDEPFGLTLDPVSSQLLVTNFGTYSVTAYARTASGNTAPLRTLAGAATGLNGPTGLAVDPINHELIVTNQEGNSVTVHPREAAGNTPPLRTLSGGATGLISPRLLAGPNLSSLVSTGTGAGGGPHVRLFQFDTVESTPAPLGGGFFAYAPGFTGGVQATLVRAQGGLFLVTGVGSGGGPHIRLFRVTDLLTGAVTPVGPGFFAYAPGFTGGARVAATTDAYGNLLIVTGAGAGGGPHINVFRVTNLVTGAVVQLGGGFFAYNPAFTGGVNVGAQ
jgi:6-phosphogluconolactonase (cycloisomerase 2 family)